jgi:hypothetical protein
VRIPIFIPGFVIALSAALLPLAGAAQVGPCVSVAVGVPPPALPVYQQPPAPMPNYIWTPGYWAWGQYGYYWVAGTWVPPPAIGLYWTPGYWAYSGGGYFWSSGYWGPTVGFYGGINYGFGYFGAGFAGGMWSGSAFRYNTAVTTVNRSVVKNVYFDKTVVNRDLRVAHNHGRVSFDGGHGGISARPTLSQRAAARDRRVGATPLQIKHAQAAGQNRNSLVAFNHGKPPVTATATPIASVNRQADFKALSAHDRVVAQTQALDRMHVVGASGPAESLAAEPAHAAAQSRPAHQPSEFHVTSASAGNRVGAAGFHPSHAKAGPPRPQVRQGNPGHARPR